MTQVALHNHHPSVVETFDHSFPLFFQSAVSDTFYSHEESIKLSVIKAATAV